MQQCRLAEEKNFGASYPEFTGFVATVSLDRQPDHELGFTVPDSVYFADTRSYVAIPDFLLTPEFLRVVSRRETLKQAKAMLRELNARRAPDDQLIFFSYESRHLGTPDNPDSFWRLLIVVPANAAQGWPEKWVQFGVPDPRARAPVRNISVVSVVPGPDRTSNAYFKDYFRTFRRNGSITVKGRWDLGFGDDNCALCHKSGILPIFPVNGTVSADEQGALRAVNERFLKYGRPRFGKYLDASKLGPGLGATSVSESVPSQVEARKGIDGVKCGACHQPQGLGALNWPMDRVLISSFVKGGQMPLGFELTPLERNRLYTKLIQDYFAIDEANPGTLKSWLLGRRRT
jgi:predicted RNase H-like HicB family nuclease